MDVCFSRRQVNMKRMNEKQLFHLGKDLIPLGDPLVYINYTRQDLFRTTQLSMQNTELMH